MYEMDSAPAELADNKDAIFSNIEEIYFFHKVYVLNVSQ